MRKVASLSVVCLAAVLWTSPAAAGASARERRGYLAEVALVLEGCRRALSWTERYLNDDRLAGFAHPLTEQYVQMAGRMVPPERLRLVHPHLLLVAENVERAVAAAEHGDLRAFRQRRRVVREEIRTLEGILKHLNLRLPELAR